MDADMKSKNKSHSESLFVWDFMSQSTAKVMLRWSVHLTTLFPGQTWLEAANQYFVHILSLVTDNNPSWFGERTKANWDKSPLGQKPTGQYPTGQKATA